MTDAYPLAWPDGWPRTPPARRTRAVFKVSPEQATQNLRQQVRMLGGQQLVISTGVPTRKDGLPYADIARRHITDPGAAIYFMLGGRSMAMACDRFEKTWQNIHSLGHAIEHMRGLDRHGGGHMIERAFTGFMALPAAGPAWHVVLGVRPDATEEEISAAYRAKAKTAHSDVGGSHAAMTELNVARDEGMKQLKARA